MTHETSHKGYFYTFKFDYHYSDLCKLESRQLFGIEEENKMLFSTIEIDPSISPFIKNRFNIISSSERYEDLLQGIKEQKISAEGFKAEYLSLHGDERKYPERLDKLKDVGYSIEGNPDYYTPTIIYSICNYNNIWYFGTLTKQSKDWFKHKKKPYSFSNSIGMNIGKTMVSISSKGNKNNRLLDACCGVGTVLLEACFAGFEIEGCDINEKAYQHTVDNLAHYNYTARVHHSDIKDLEGKYDAAVIDLPYNLYAYSDEVITLNIIKSTAKLTSRVVIVSMSDIEPIIEQSGLKVSDFCTVEKRGKMNFTRSIWVCERKAS